jgi:hypothetical protein
MENNKTSELLKNHIYPFIDIYDAFSDLSPKETSSKKNYTCICPSCGKKRAYISFNKTKGYPQVSCNRKDSCGYFSDIWSYVQEKGNLSKADTLKELARLANYDLETNTTTSNTSANAVPLDRLLSNANNKVKYVEFKENKEYAKISISKYLPKYNQMNEVQKLKMIFTYIYQYSLQTNQDKKNKYYKSRKIDLNNKYIKQIGFLSTHDVKKLEKILMDLFPIKDLLEFGVMKIKIKDEHEILDRNGNPVYVFKQYCFKGFCVIPNYDLYSSTVTGLKLRNIEMAEWQSKNLKEPEMSRRDLVYPLPFAFSREMLLDNNSCIFLVEGHVDGLSLPVSSSKCGQTKIDYEKSNTYFIASPGVNGISEEFLGLLKGKFICLCFDQDVPGRKGAYGEIIISYGEEKSSFVNDFKGKEDSASLIKDLEAQGIPFYKSVLRGMSEKLQQAGARVFVKHWDINLGGDINELLKNGNLDKVFKL